MLGVDISAAFNAVPALRDPERSLRGGAAVERRTPPGSAAICPHRVARWAWGEGLRAGDVVALLVQDLGQAEAMRLGLTRIGLTVACLDNHRRDAALADSLAWSGASLAIVDTALAPAYAGMAGRLASLPSVWWNGPDADFASLDAALAEQD